MNKPGSHRRPITRNSPKSAGVTERPASGGNLAPGREV
jgi:hypothetical protein